MRLVGDRKAWRAIFSDNYPALVSRRPPWPEGPTWIEEEKALIFSDTITGKLHIWKDGAITLLKEHAGGCAVVVDGGWIHDVDSGSAAAFAWRAESPSARRRAFAGVPGSRFHERGTHC